MSNAEHLIENALEELKAGHDFDSFKALWHTPVMCEQLGIKPETVWEMACYAFNELRRADNDYIRGYEDGCSMAQQLVNLGYDLDNPG